MGNFFTDLFSDQPAKDAANALKQGYSTGLTNANSTLDAGQAGADKLYQQAYTPFSQLYSKFGAGQDAYNDATGVNGQAGLDRAKATYTSIPGYSGGLNTGIDQVMRTAAARGDLAGGNTSADEIKFASDYDAQKYGNYLSSLAPNLSGATSAASGGAGVLTGQAGSDLGVAGTKASNQWNAATGSGQADANADLARYNASSNFWSSLLGGASLGLKAFGVGGFAPGTKAA
ncbi:hypothetical protein KUL72_20775 [Bradyrhizobium arachidis]|uniref:hypothetical protein n=1 Tax=Bradyrhizobium arachidis TaxID=858423 RepID=UPI0021619070|nr:hypothetical protein [Bradyrhizobium arachidis]UVO33951.1 hypothetical protein KUL72_20775 [Bradyrhizobium arachidis]